MIDRRKQFALYCRAPYDFNETGTFASAEPLYRHPTPGKHMSGEFWHVLVDKEPSDSIPKVMGDEHLLLASPIVYGFSLTVKRWCEEFVFAEDLRSLIHKQLCSMLNA
jgi:hypothetical protein